MLFVVSPLIHATMFLAESVWTASSRPDDGWFWRSRVCTTLGDDTADRYRGSAMPQRSGFETPSSTDRGLGSTWVTTQIVDEEGGGPRQPLFPPHQACLRQLSQPTMSLSPSHLRTLSSPSDRFHSKTSLGTQFVVCITNF